MLEKLFYLAIFIISSSGYFGIALLSLLGSAIIPIPNELVMLFAGFEAANGKFSLSLVIFFGLAGNFIGTIVSYYVGFYGGRSFIERYGRYILFSEKKLKLTEQFFNKHGDIAVFITRLIPIVRAVASVPAGIAEMDIKKFSFYSLLGSFVWVLSLSYLGVFLGPHYKVLMSWFHRFDLVIIIALIAGLVFYIRWSVKE